LLLSHRFAEDCVGSDGGDARRVRVGSSQSGNLQKRFTRARKHAKQIALFGACFVD
jgi:hypothetical protein